MRTYSSSSAAALGARIAALGTRLRRLRIRKRTPDTTIHSSETESSEPPPGTVQTFRRQSRGIDTRVAGELALDRIRKNTGQEISGTRPAALSPPPPPPNRGTFTVEGNVIHVVSKRPFRSLHGADHNAEPEAKNVESPGLASSRRARAGSDKRFRVAMTTNGNYDSASPS